MDSNLLKTKSIEQLVSDVEHGKHLKRALSAVDLTLLGIGAIIGTGIFVLTGTAAANQAGPAITASYMLAGLACGFAALCYAEFAAMVPISGSAYTYAYATLGELVAWIIGWDLIIEYAVGNVAVAISWANYFRTLLEGVGIRIPLWLSTDYRTAARIPGLYDSAPHVFGVPIVVNLVAFAIGIKMLALLLMFPGWLTLWMAIMADMGASIVVTLNGIRLLRWRA